MDKAHIHRLILDKLGADLQLLQRAAQTAYEAATDAENIAENKYDTLGLEASYLATGQARRAAEIKQALGLFENLSLRPFDPARGIQLSALVVLANEDGGEQWLFLGPEAAGLKVVDQGREITVISPRSPLGQALLGKAEGAEVAVAIGNGTQTFEVLEVH
jgi:transcription elongation GreA/GreB family factor